MHELRIVPLALVALLQVVAIAGCSTEPKAAQTDATGDALGVQAEKAEPDRSVADVSSAPVSLRNPRCLSYGEWRTNLTSDGPPYPLPTFAPAVERRCVVAYRDIRSDLLTILSEGKVPEQSSRPLVFGNVPDAGGLEDTTSGLPKGMILIRARTSMGGQANADAILRDGWDRPAIGRAYPAGEMASWRGITIEGELAPAALRAAIGSLAGEWAGVPAGATGNKRLAGINAAARWDRLGDGRHLLAEVGAPDIRDGSAGDDRSIYVHLKKTGRRVVAAVFPSRGDAISCYRGTLDARGRLHNAQFVDASPDPGAIKSVDGLGTVIPDQLTSQPLRPASARVRKLRDDVPWLGDRCESLFNGEQDPAPTPLAN